MTFSCLVHLSCDTTQCCLEHLSRSPKTNPNLADDMMQNLQSVGRCSMLTFCQSVGAVGN
eukprot:m.284270 g.284270  ORF g.284270 m.284270 type:complete len:60 (-) comp15761_c2_seq14:1627-1806(-)